MKIAIVTVYHPVTNLGSFLQAYALYIYLTGKGHEVSFVQTVPNLKSSIKMPWRLIPKRGMVNRVLKMYHSYSDIMKLPFRDIWQSGIQRPDCMIYGSDEIWNVCNPFFLRPVFWRNLPEEPSRITYAISVGHACVEDFKSYPETISAIKDFDAILSRDKHTTEILQNFVKTEIQNVVDPTLLIPSEYLQRPIKLPSKKYILVYTYGIDQHMIELLKNFARNNGLKIVSPCFYHTWSDMNIECSALQFGSLIQGAEYVFTTTFHGAIFSLLNHSRCAIMPMRPKVGDICKQLKSESRLLSLEPTYTELEKVLNSPLNKTEFDDNLTALRMESERTISSVLKDIKSKNHDNASK